MQNLDAKKLKHLHERGEDRNIKTRAVLQPETPPRAWRRPFVTLNQYRFTRNTSTSVEKTCNNGHRQQYGKKHLHERGEDLLMKCENLAVLETPPRAWRRLPLSATGAHGAGNTSTSVEKTILKTDHTNTEKKHLHERGEDCPRQDC